MNFTSLPEEMLRKVLNCATFSSVVKLRKMNNQIDKIARRNKICDKIPVVVLRIEMHEDNTAFAIPILYLADFRSLGLKSTLLPRFHGCLSTLLERCLAKVEIRRQLVIKDDYFGEKEFQVLYNNRHYLRKVTELVFIQTRIELPSDRVKLLFLQVFPKINELIIHLPRMNKEFSFTEALAVRSWKTLELYSDYALAFERGSATEFLNVVATTRNVSLENTISTGITLLDVIGLVKRCIRIDGTYNRQLRLGSINLGEIALVDMETTIKRHLPGVVIQSCGIRGYQVMFPNYAYLQFALEKNTFEHHWI